MRLPTDHKIIGRRVDECGTVHVTYTRASEGHEIKHWATDVNDPAKIESVLPDTEDWDKIVQRVRELREHEGEIRWELGDLALRVAPKGDPGQHNEANERLAMLAVATDYEESTLRAYRDVAWAWPATTRVVGASWSAHRLLIAATDGQAVLAELADEHASGRVTVARVQEWRAAQGETPARPEAEAVIFAEATGTPTPTKGQHVNVRPSLKATQVDLGKAVTQLMRAEAKIQELPASDVRELLEDMDRLAERCDDVRRLMLKIVSGEVEGEAA